MKRLFLPILVTLSMFTVSCDKDSVTNPDDVPVSVTESELKEAFYYTFPLMIMDGHRIGRNKYRDIRTGHTSCTG